MIMEIIVGTIGLAFVILVIFLIKTLKRVNKVMKNADRALTDMHHILNTLSGPGSELVHNANKLVVDIKKKSEGLDVLFHPLYALKRGKSDTIPEIIGLVTEGIRLFTKIRNEMK